MNKSSWNRTLFHISPCEITNVIYIIIYNYILCAIICYVIKYYSSITYNNTK